MEKAVRYMTRAFWTPVEALITYWPNPVGIPLRCAFYRKKLKHLGEKATIDEGVHIINPEHVSIGDNTWIDKNVILIAGKPEIEKRRVFWKKNEHYNGEVGELSIGRNCHIAPNVVIQAHGGVRIGDCVGIASGSKLYSMSHHYRNLDVDDEILYKFTPRAPPNEQYLIIGPIVMKNNTALGLNSSLLPGVTIFENSWVGVNSCVMNDIPSNSIAAGSPAKVIRSRLRSP